MGHQAQLRRQSAGAYTAERQGPHGPPERRRGHRRRLRHEAGPAQPAVRRQGHAAHGGGQGRPGTQAAGTRLRHRLRRGRGRGSQRLPLHRQGPHQDARPVRALRGRARQEVEAAGHRVHGAPHARQHRAGRRAGPRRPREGQDHHGRRRQGRDRPRGRQVRRRRQGQGRPETARGRALPLHEPRHQVLRLQPRHRRRQAGRALPHRRREALAGVARRAPPR